MTALGSPSAPGERRLRWRGWLARPAVAVITLYVASRLIFYAAGIRFDARELDSFWHFIDPPLLENHLLESILYQHTLPPLYNLYLGLGLKVFGGAAPSFYWASHWAAGLVLGLSLLSLLRRLGASKKTSVITTALVLILPASILYENFLFYTYLVTASLYAAALLLHRALANERIRDFAAFFAVLALITLTRSLFHLVWFVACVAVLGVTATRPKRVLAAACLPLLVAAAPYVKNWLLFGEATNSSWFGMSMARMTLRQLPDETKRAWIARGELSPIAAVQPFRAPASYYPFVAPPAPTGHAILDQETKASGAPNLHHGIMVEVSRRFSREAMVVFRTSPEVYAKSVGMALARYFDPASAYHPLDPNRRSIRGYERAYNTIVHWSWGFSRGGFMLLLLPAAAVYSVYRARRHLRAGDRPSALTFLFLACNIAYVTAVGCLFEIGENNRFRFQIEPFVWTVAVLAIGEHRLVRRRSPARRQATRVRVQLEASP